MTPIYKNSNKSISDLLNDYRSGSLVIPSIQRPYVWKPSQLARFFDSLLHGWPCGTLLIWNTERQQNIFPVRQFNQGYIDENDCHDSVNEEYYNGSYRSLVLDGQQRIQSLIYVLDPHTQGYKISSKKWAADIGSNKGNKENIVKYLCFNLSVWDEGNHADSYFYGDLESVDDSLLRWFSEEEILGSNGQYVKLCNALDNDSVPPSLNEKIRNLFNLPIPVLEVSSSLVSACMEGNEEDTIVSIFTRLNTSGTPLTKEQILAAQIKRAWHEFPQKVEDLQADLQSKAITVDIDDLVNGFNILVRVITQKDEVKDAYQVISTNKKWEEVWADFKVCSLMIFDTLSNRAVRFKIEYNSLYVVWFPMVLWYFANKSKNEEMGAEFVRCLLKWVFLTSWAKIWANRSNQFVSKYTKGLLEFSKSMSNMPVTSLDAVNQACLVQFKGWLRDASLVEAAKNTIDSMASNIRGNVRSYYQALWIWSHLNEKRAERLYSFDNQNAAFQVDHILPASWVKRLDANIRPQFNSIGNCWLLASYANTAKSNSSFTEFLASYGLIDKIQVIGSEIDCTEQHLKATEDNLEDVLSEIEARELRIKSDLIAYIVDEVERELFVSAIQKAQQVEYRHNTTGIYKGDEYIKHPSFTNLSTTRSQQSYLSYIRTAIKSIEEQIGGEIDWPHVEGSPEDLRKLMNHEAVPPNTRSGWKKYMNFLLDPTQNFSARTQKKKSPNQAEDVEKYSNLHKLGIWYSNYRRIKVSNGKLPKNASMVQAFLNVSNGLKSDRVSADRLAQEYCRLIGEQENPQFASYTKARHNNNAYIFVQDGNEMVLRKEAHDILEKLGWVKADY